MIDIDNLFLSAFEHYKAGKIQQAEDICNEILQSSPSHADALYLMGIIKLQLSDFDSSIEYLSKALEIMPSCADAYYAMGDVFRKKGQLDQAIDSYQKALHLRPDLPDAYYTMGDIYEEKHMFDEAASCYREAVRIEPNNAHAYARLGFAFYNLRQLDEATRCFEKAIQLNPKYDEAYICLGMIFREKGQSDEAIAYLNKALKINSESAWIYTNLGATMQHKGQREEGRMYLHKALEKNTNIHSVQHNLDNLLLHDQESLTDKMSSEKQNTQKILIVVSAFNRKKVTALSLGQTKRYKTASCSLHVYNDHSTEYDNSFLTDYADEVIQLPDKMGIDKLRWYQFRKFLKTDYDFLYLTDSDVIHDPHYVFMLEMLYEKGKRKLPVSLFNSIFTFQPRMILYHKDGVLLKTTAPGTSMFYDRQMVEKILSASEQIGNIFDYLPWDNRAVVFLGLPWVTSKLSYLEHFGAYGMHNDNFERDRAINPTEYLQKKREIVIDYLMQDNGVEPLF
jgi:tetratricopeptide (TPR) repeat protein